MKAEIEFLTADDVISIHAEQVKRYGGRRGIKDRKLLESAVSAPQTMTLGKFLYTELSEKADKKGSEQSASKRQYAYKDIYEMAGVMAYQISYSKCFVNGNMRTGLLAALTFLDINGVTMETPTDELFEMMMDIEQFKQNILSLTELLRAMGEG
ncbi:type II toxin-antitoxin system death-on-curing family toxin [bacterium]|nr:type II toxin-antitoxin system death-on-curing family toxin [bacterium]